MKGMVIISKLIRIIPYTYYLLVQDLATLIIIPLIKKATLYVVIIIY